MSTIDAYLLGGAAVNLTFYTPWSLLNPFNPQSLLDPFLIEPLFENSILHKKPAGS